MFCQLAASSSGWLEMGSQLRHQLTAGQQLEPSWRLVLRAPPRLVGRPLARASLAQSQQMNSDWPAPSPPRSIPAAAARGDARHRTMAKSRPGGRLARLGTGQVAGRPAGPRDDANGAWRRRVAGVGLGLELEFEFEPPDQIDSSLGRRQAWLAAGSTTVAAAAAAAALSQRDERCGRL